MQSAIEERLTNARLIFLKWNIRIKKIINTATNTPENTCGCVSESRSSIPPVSMLTVGGRSSFFMLSCISIVILFTLYPDIGSAKTLIVRMPLR